MAYIHEHKDGWRAQVVKLGVRKSAVWATKREAKEWAARVEAEIAAGKINAKKPRTFDELADAYLEQVTSKKRGEQWETRRIDSFREHFKGKILAEIDTPDMVEWREKRLKDVSSSTVVREANILRNMFNVAVDEWRWIDRNPFKGMKMPKENPPRQAMWGWKQIKRLLRANTTGKTREAVEAFHIALRTGMRLQEVLAAPEHFDAVRKVVTVPTKTNPRGDEIPIGRIACKLLDRQPFTVGANEASVLFSKLCQKQMITGLTFHDSRATALTHLARKVDVLRLAKISRHKDIALLSRVYYREKAEDIASLI